MTNEELVEEYRQTGNRDLLGMLYENNLPLIAEWCKPYSRISAMEDLLQSAFIGMAEAVSVWDVSKGRFVTILRFYVLKSCRDYVLKSHDLWNLKHVSHSLNEKQDIGDEGGAIEKINLLADDHNTESDVFEKITSDGIRDLWELSRQKLSARSYEILFRRYRLKQSFREIGSALGISAVRVRVIHNAELEKLSHERSVKRMWCLVNSQNEFRGGLAKFKHYQESKPEYIALLRCEFDELMSDQIDKV